MIIPTLRNIIRPFKIGDTVILTENYQRSSYMLTIGHELIIVGKDDWGFIFKETEEGMILKKCSNMAYTHKVTLKESKKSHKNHNEAYRFLKFIDDNCPQKSYTYEDRDKVDTCKWREKERRTDNSGWKYCKPSCECIKYIPEKKYENNSFILNYNRRLKLKKLKKLNHGNIKTD